MEAVKLVLIGLCAYKLSSVHVSLLKSPSLITQISFSFSSTCFILTFLTMKLPVNQPATTFINAPQSTVPEEFAMQARKLPSNIGEMAETPQEATDLKKEALARQYVLLIDKSASMQSPDGAGTRWSSTELAVRGMVDAVFKYDIDHSIPVFLFGDRVDDIGELTDSSQVLQLFKEYQPDGRSTNLAAGLQAALSKYLGSKRENYEYVPGTTVIIFTDGKPDSEGAVRDYIKEIVDPSKGYISNHEELALSFIQVGDDAGASKFLKGLDDGFAPDICDTKKDDDLRQAGGIERVLFDAIFD